MKKILVSLVAMMFLFAPMAFGLTIEDVVQADELLYATSLGNSGEATELAWINDKLDTEFTLLNKTDFDEATIGDVWTQVANTTIWAFDFGTEINPGYFMIKTGSGVKLVADDIQYTHFLFENKEATRYAAVDFSLFYQQSGNSPIQELGLTKFSHISYPSGTPVPEPSTLLLFGAGIAGLAMYRRKRS